MIPELPLWSDTDFESKPYVGPLVKPPPKPEWDLVGYSLGPAEYGVASNNLAVKWWAVVLDKRGAYSQFLIYPATPSGSGWDNPIMYKHFAYSRVPLSLALGFNRYGRAYVAAVFDDNYGPPNSVSHYSHFVDEYGNDRVDSGYHFNTRSPVIAVDKSTQYPEDMVTYLFYITNENYVTYVTDVGQEKLPDDDVAVQSLLVGPSWELLHGGYRVDGKFQLAYRHDLDDPLPEQPVQRVEYDRMSLVSPPFKFTKNFSSTITHGTIGSARIDTITVPSAGDTADFKGLALTGIVVKTPIVNQKITEAITPTVPALNKLEIQDPSIRKDGGSETMNIGITTPSVKVTTTRVDSTSTETQTFGSVTIDAVSLITL